MGERRIWAERVLGVWLHGALQVRPGVCVGICKAVGMTQSAWPPESTFVKGTRRSPLRPPLQTARIFQACPARGGWRGCS